MSILGSDDESTVSSFEDESNEDLMEKEDSEAGVLEENTGSLLQTPPQIVKKKNEQNYITAPIFGEKDMRKSSKIMTQFEYCRLISTRAELISQNEPIHPKYRDVPTFDLLEIAKMELDDEDIPFPLNVLRPIDLPTMDAKIIEVFNARELKLPQKVLVQHIKDYLPENNWTIKNQIN